jgi:hypothetical protein
MRKKPARKVLRKTGARRKATATKGPQPIGKITHYFDKLRVGIIKLRAPLETGKYIAVRGHGKDFVQKVSSMQLNHKNITKAKKGWEIGIKVDGVVKEGDQVYLEKTPAQTAAQSFSYTALFNGKPERPAFLSLQKQPPQMYSQIAKPAAQPSNFMFPQMASSPRTLSPSPMWQKPATPVQPKAASPKKPADYRDTKFLSF